MKYLKKIKDNVHYVYVETNKGGGANIRERLETQKEQITQYGLHDSNPRTVIRGVYGNRQANGPGPQQVRGRYFH